MNRLDVEGGAVIGATYSGTNTAPANGLFVEGNVGIGTTTTNVGLQVANSAVFGSGSAFADGTVHIRTTSTTGTALTLEGVTGQTGD